ncbi:hypothetical protein [Actinokineospora cianjurensis]|uniref:Uncharacterized protein n=1 Tax=Actinokineospora cianjurensis TaxID=585224 RepID=A0A421AVV0_9PSEU|nr:hypothetical protein [Actinokineospora cianjurensis]RLK54148.1 hypothetical protein CLV68_6150 [Actinokineospora cianjurensis]
MVNKRLRPTALLRLTRKVARQHKRSLVEESGRGKGSHRLYLLLDEGGAEVGRIVVPDHARELSWTVLRSIEDALAHELGERWMEEK